LESRKLKRAGIIVRIIAFIIDASNLLSYSMLITLFKLGSDFESSEFLRLILKTSFFLHIITILLPIKPRAIYLRLGTYFMNLDIVDTNGNKPSYIQLIKRNIFFIISWWTFGLINIYALFNENRETIADRVSNTIVVTRRKKMSI